MSYPPCKHGYSHEMLQCPACEAEHRLEFALENKRVWENQAHHWKQIADTRMESLITVSAERDACFDELATLRTDLATKDAQIAALTKERTEMGAFIVKQYDEEVALRAELSALKEDMAREHAERVRLMQVGDLQEKDISALTARAEAAESRVGIWMRLYSLGKLSAEVNEEFRKALAALPVAKLP